MTGSGPVHKAECWAEARFGEVGANTAVLKRDSGWELVGRTVDRRQAVPRSKVRVGAFTAAQRSESLGAVRGVVGQAFP